MEPIVAFSLAGTILQFVDSGTRFAALAWRLYQHGSDDVDDHVHLLKITEDLNAVLPKLKPMNHEGDGENSLAQLAVDCGKTTVRLLTILQTVQTTKDTRKRDAVKAAFKLVYRKDEINSLQDQLSSFRNQLNLHLLLSLR